MTRVAVVGAGSWGTALSAVLAKKGHDTCLWAFEPNVAEQITLGRENTTYLPGIDLPENLRSTADLATAVQGAKIVVSVSPAQVVGVVMAEAARHIQDDALVISASKGLELTTLRRMDEVLAEVLSPEQFDGFTVLSGPSFALEVAQQVPTAVVAASEHADAAGGYLVFGRETSGLPDDVRESIAVRNAAHLLRIPVSAECRSLNLSNTVALVLYEALRQQGFPGLVTAFDG